MNSENDFLREEPPAYGAASRPSPILTYLRKVEAAHAQGNDTEHTHRPAFKRAPLKLSWNKLHVLSREEICLGANISKKMAHKPWEELEQWLQMQLADSIALRSKGKNQLDA